MKRSVVVLTALSLCVASVLAASALSDSNLLTNIASVLPAASISPSVSSSITQSDGKPLFVGAENQKIVKNSDVAIDDSGAAVAVWKGAEDEAIENRRIWANYFDGKGWGKSVMIESPGSSDSKDAQVVAVAPGHMVTIWDATSNGKKAENSGFVSFMDARNGVWSAVYKAPGQWSTAQLVSRAPPEFSTNHPRIAAVLGNAASSANAASAIAVWLEYYDFRGRSSIPRAPAGMTTHRIMSAVYSAATGWGVPIQISDSAAVGAESPEVTINKQGQAIAVWLEKYDDGGPARQNPVRRAFYSSFQLGSSQWSKPQMIEAPEAVNQDVSNVVVSSNDAGDVVFAWVQYANNCGHAFAKRSIKTEASQKVDIAWEPAKRLTPILPSPSNGDRVRGKNCSFLIRNMKVGLDASGNTLVAWDTANGPFDNQVYAAYAPVGSAWQPQTWVPQSEDADTTGIRFAFVAPGKAVVLSVYNRSNPERYHIVAHRFEGSNASQPWSGSELIDQPDGGSAFSVRLAVNANGQAISTWSQDIKNKSVVSSYTWNTNTTK
jgi:hypothetical protein